MAGRFAIGWAQVAICFMLLACDSMITSAYGIVAVPLEKDFHTSIMVLMLANTVMAGGSALLAPVLGSMLDRKSLRLMMMTGGVLLALGYGALSFATAFWQVLVIFGLIVAPANVLIGPVAATVLLSRWFVVHRGRAIGIAIAGVATGTIVFAPVIQMLFEAFPWREGMRLLAVILLVATVGPAMFIVGRPAERGLHADGAATEPPELVRAESESPVSAWEVLSDPTFWLVAAIFATVLSGMAGMVTNLSKLAMQNGAGEERGVLTMMYGFGGLTAKLGFAAVADRLGPRRLMFMSLAGFTSGVACLTQAQFGFWTIGLGVTLIGLFGGIMVPLQSILMPRIFGERVVGKAMGLLSMVTLVALLSSPPLFGRVNDVTGSYAPVFIGYAALALCMVLMVPYVRLHRRSDHATGAKVFE